jgi:hypothetical protein
VKLQGLGLGVAALAVADQLRPRFDSFASLMDEARTDVLGPQAFPMHHWHQLHSPTRSSASTVRSSGRADVVAIYPMSTPSCARSGKMLKQNAGTRRYMMLETLDGLRDDAAARPPHYRCSLIRAPKLGS